MTSAYSFLEPYVCRGYKGPRNRLNSNIFYEVCEKEILAAEQRLGILFPSELRQFYQEIGTGYLTTPQYPPSAYKFHATNEILPPLVAVYFYEGIIEHHTIKEKEEALNYNNNHCFAQEALELTNPGDLPFFEIGDSSSFLVMKPNSERPNAVYSEGGVLVEEEFSKFIWRLYYESPSYYNDVIMDYYDKMDGKM